MSEIVNIKPNGQLPHASSVSGAPLSDALVPNLLSVQGSGVSTVAATCYERGPVVLAGVKGGVTATGVIAGGAERGGIECGDKRPAMAPVATKARANASASAAHGADAQLFGQQKTQLFPMWALRGLDPWSEPT